jgi:hypothetical protein
MNDMNEKKIRKKGSGRKKIPENLRKEPRTLFLTKGQWEEIESLKDPERTHAEIYYQLFKNAYEKNFD